MCQAKLAAIVFAACAGSALAGGVEYYSTTLVWERDGPHSTPWTFSAEPMAFFDTMGGERRLGRVRIHGRDSWHSRVMVDNPTSVCQCIEYTDYNVEAWAQSSAGHTWIVLGPGRSNRLGAAPFSQALAEQFSGSAFAGESLMKSGGGSMSEFIGVGPMTFEITRVSSGYDTFGLYVAGCGCVGGFRGPPLAFFDETYARFELELNLEYHWIEADCPVDLTTWANPSTHPQQYYGVPDGVVDSEDFFYYLDQYAAGNLAVADLTGGAIAGQPGYGVPDGVLNNDDFFYFLTRFAEGC